MGDEALVLGLNIGLGLMLCANLIPMGGMQLYDAVRNGYWHARQPEFFQQPWVRTIEWFRMPGDLIFLLVGVLPVVYLAIRMFLARGRYAQLPADAETERFTQAYESQ